MLVFPLSSSQAPRYSITVVSMYMDGNWQYWVVKYIHETYTIPKDRKLFFYITYETKLRGEDALNWAICIRIVRIHIHEMQN